MDAARKIHLAAAALAQGARLQTLSKPLRIWGPDSDRRLDQLAGIAKSTGSVPPDRHKTAVQTDGWNKSGLGDPGSLEALTVRFGLATRSGSHVGSPGAR